MIAFAWMVRAENGNVIMWHTVKDAVEKCAEKYGRPLEELFIGSQPGIGLESHHLAALERAALSLGAEVQRLATQNDYDAMFPEGDAKAIREVLAFLQQPIGGKHADLMRFYCVPTVDALIEIQAKHVERLQAKLPATPSLAPQRVREG